MDDPDELAPAVRSILSAARDRADPGPGRGETVSVAPRDLAAAFERAEADGRVPVIAEVKPTSPTTEGSREDDPVALAEGMVAGGAAALSVLTEPDHFGGSVDTLERVRDAVDVPVLRKDFVVDEGQLDAVDSDVVLLIARFVGDDLSDLLAAARDRGFRVLVEVHDRDELVAALDAGATTVGVNNRDLAALDVDLGTVESVAPRVPDDVTLIAESGIGSPADVRRMRAAGADALLVGSAIMDGDVEANTREFVRAEADGGEADASGESDASGGSTPRDTTETPT
ncbi:indole-3-glycerol-phosphate synthase [Halorubrum sp. BOL3-1]|uniref:indole-3-glycerol phosphate synthase n=1 Tax=Halorubrum sp. BOL3-1 TaxID=2497325 RepID=UPI001004E53B|nr:indole-3-glycerol phosphate synthase [Halorubrum sp. BOL3-1]QAU11956.1 indole-3-glycerol-phosphate synthase [Halorubrum sp. BOL3-1]